MHYPARLVDNILTLTDGSIKYMHEDMDIHSLFGASTSSSVASSSAHMEKGSNCSDSDSDIAEPSPKKSCRELIQPSDNEEKIIKELENEYSRLVYDEDINGVFSDFVNRPQ